MLHATKINNYSNRIENICVWLCSLGIQHEARMGEVETTSSNFAESFNIAFTVSTFQRDLFKNPHDMTFASPFTVSF